MINLSESLIQRRKAQLNMSFGWLFALLAGGFILFLAIYGSIKLINVEQTIQDVKSSKEMGNLLNPLETGFESGKSTSITFPMETRVRNKCSDFGYFGEQTIQVSQKSFNKWSNTNIDVTFPSKYLFSSDVIEGKDMTIFVKTFTMPFKVTDLIYIVPRNEAYCFVDAPDDIADEISSINMPNIKSKNCSELDSPKEICFEKGGCDITVVLSGNKVLKENEAVFFLGTPLMYAAIFSEEGVYECQVKRLMKRLANLALIYKNKGDFLVKQGCNSNVGSELLAIENAARSLESPVELLMIKNIAEILGEKNDANSECKLW